jgi:8-oxo-dGTP pyrophosphatase MutT (NUDIX family)
MSRIMGNPAVWMKDMNLIKIIRESLNNRTPGTIENSRSRYAHASVLIPILEQDGQYSVLFTRRTNKVEHHKGQISFPGGAVDEEDNSYEETAYREAYEEVGLLRKDVEMLGRTDDELAIVSSFIIHPFVGRVKYPYDFQINALEVASLIIMPFYVFLDGTNTYKKDFVNVEGYPYHGTNYHFDGNVVWGATARVMENFIGIIEDKIKLA